MQKNYRFVQYTPMKCFNHFVQSAVNARREGNENPNSSVVAQTKELLANSSYAYQIMDRSTHTVTEYLSDEKNTWSYQKKFKSLDFMNEQMYEVELVKSDIEHKEPIIIGFFILQYAKLRKLELYYNFFDKYCDVNMFEEMEMVTETVHLALAEQDLYDCIRPAMKKEWESLRSGE